MFSQFAEGSPERIGAYMGAGFTIVIRLTLLVLYSVALVKFSQWAQKQQADVTFA